MKDLDRPARASHPRAWRALGALLCTTAALVLAPWQAAQAARLALVIGNDGYEQITPLRNARADAQTMADTLRAVGYEVDLKTDRSQREMLDDVRALRQRIRGGDEVVFFFSGHGVQIGASNHLLPVNVRNQNEDQVRDDALELSRVLADLRSAKPAFTLAIVDACRNNPFASAGKSIGGRGLTGVAGASGQMVIYAAGEGQQALDRLGNNDTVRNGLFTRVFARQMRQAGVPVHQVLRNVRTEVARAARTVGHEQVPAIYDQVEGDFYFVAGGRVEPVVTPAPAPAPAPVLATCKFCPEMVVMPAGSFVMGSPASESERFPDEGPQRTVRVASFELGKYEVTQGQWKAVMGGNPSHFSTCGDDCPVEQVSWNDVQAYIRKLNEMTGRSYRLPTEAEWEYAARAGTATPFHTGPTINTAQANFDGNFTYNGSVKGEYRAKTTRGGSFAANAWGLHDLHGNVWEWVQDVRHDDYVGAPVDGNAWTGGGDQARRMLRGGSWFVDPRTLRSAYRNRHSPDIRGNDIGFRIARSL